MPYITSENREIHVENIAALVVHLEKEIGNDTERGKYIFFRVLTTLFDALEKRIRHEEKEMRYKHFNHLDGAFDCAWKELWRRWGVHVPIAPKAGVWWSDLDEEVGQYVTEEDCRAMRPFVDEVVSKFSTEIHALVGEVNYTISEVANALANSQKALPQDLLDMAFGAAQHLYFAHAGPYEDIAIKKNGDTEGFRLFELTYGQE